MNQETHEWAEKEATDFARRFTALMGPMIRNAAMYGIERGIQRAEEEADEVCTECMADQEAEEGKTCCCLGVISEAELAERFKKASKDQADQKCKFNHSLDEW